MVERGNLLLDWRIVGARSSIEPTIDAQLDGTGQRKGENEDQRNEEGGRRRWRDFPRGWWLVVREVRGRKWITYTYGGGAESLAQ